MEIFKSFEEISKSSPYQGHTITKGECIGHVQKRVGSRLRTIKGKWEKNFLMVKKLDVGKEG